MQTFDGNAVDLERSLSSIDPKMLRMARELGTLIKEKYPDDPDAQGKLFAQGMNKALERDKSNLNTPETSLEAAKKINEAAIVAEEMAQAAGLPEEKSFFEKFRTEMKKMAMQIAAGDAFLEIDTEAMAQEEAKKSGKPTPQQQRATLHKQTESILSGEMPDGISDDIAKKPKNLKEAVKIGATKAAVALMAGTDAEREYSEGLKRQFDLQDEKSGKAPTVSAQIRKANAPENALPNTDESLEKAGQGVDLQLTEMQKSPLKTAFKRMASDIANSLGVGDKNPDETGAQPMYVPPEVAEQANKSAAPPPPEGLRELAASLREGGATSLGREDLSHLGEEHAASTPAAARPKAPQQEVDLTTYYAKKGQK